MIAVVDRPARARTRAGRLAPLDVWLLKRESSLPDRSERSSATAVFLDVGFGERPVTTLETWEALRAVSEPWKVIGIELDPSRALRAQDESGSDQVSFVRGGFREVASCEPKARVIRVMNVLRSYPPDQIESIHRMLAGGLVNRGLLIEGTSDTCGHVLAAWLIRREGNEPRKRGLLFHTDFTRGFCPWLLRDFLPRDIRRGVQQGTPIHGLLSDWHAAWSVVRAQGEKSPRELFVRSLASLAMHRADVDPCTDLDPGFALWKLTGSEPLDGRP
ncbi:MAG: methylase [Deltaproteobacteria bacterium]|nr:methylase [Deltaproteobacteria bacterium]